MTVWKPIEGLPFDVASRVDAKGREIEVAPKVRPWLVLSDDGVHAHDLFIAPPLNSSPVRTVRGLCVEDKTERPDGRIDAQQLWTMPNDRVISLSRSKIGDHSVPATRKLIRNYLEYSPGPRLGWLYQGRVVWVRLAPSRWIRLPNGQKRPAITSDVEHWRRMVEQLTGEKPSSPEDWLLPAVVITSDAYLPTKSKKSRVSDIYPLATVVPLVLEPSLLTPGAPSVPDPTHAEIVYAPLTQCLLSLDYLACDADGRPGMIVDRPGLSPWHVADQTRRVIISEVLSFMNIQPDGMS